jgi:hypothetical protein
VGGRERESAGGRGSLLEGACFSSA